MASISSAADQARNNLQKIEHFVVLMLENRSFDQMLGHLELEGHEVDGVKRNEDKPLINWYNGDPYELRKATRTGLTTAEDPCHEGWCVADQLSTDYDENTGEPIKNGGFVRNFAATHPAADPWAVMEYFGAEQVPVYNYLANQFCVADRWFCSVPGATWPNRLYAVAGTAAGSLDNESLPLYNCSSFLRQFDEVSRLNGGLGPPGAGTPAIPPRCVSSTTATPLSWPIGLRTSTGLLCGSGGRSSTTQQRASCHPSRGSTLTSSTSVV